MARPRIISDDDILAAAREAFTEHGPRVSVAVVARTLGVTPSALFHRMGSKEELMRSALAPRRARAVDALREGPRGDAPVGEQLVEILTDLLAFLHDVVPGLLVLRAAGLVPDDEGAGTPPPVLLRGLLAAWLERGHDAGRVSVEDPRACAEALLGALEARCFNHHVGGERYAPGAGLELVRSLVAAFVREAP